MYILLNKTKKVKIYKQIKSYYIRRMILYMFVLYGDTI